MKKVLICIDDSENDVKVAQEGILIAKRMNAEISFMHVVDTSSKKSGVETRKAKAKSNIESILNKCRCSALIYIEEGNPSEKIIEKAKTIEADLIVLGNNSGEGKLSGRVVKNVTKSMKNTVIIV